MDRLYLLQDLISDPEADPVAVSKAASLVDAAIYIPEVKLLVTKFPLLINIFVRCLPRLLRIRLGRSTSSGTLMTIGWLV